MTLWLDAFLVATLFMVFVLTGCVSNEAYGRIRYNQGRYDQASEELRTYKKMEDEAQANLDKEKLRILMQSLDRIAEKSCRDEQTQQLRDAAAGAATNLKSKGKE